MATPRPPIATPVSIAFDGERAFFRSYDKAWKTKRLRRNPAVEAAPATLRGQPVGPAIPARAILLDGDQARVAARALARRHRILQAILVPGRAPHDALPHHALRATPAVK
jgi:PPOX class probable F420-dependent enzyme